MYFVVVKFQTKPEWTDRWLDLVDDFTTATRQVPGTFGSSGRAASRTRTSSCLVEAFTDDGAGPHVASEHFKRAIEDMPHALARTPLIVSRQVDGDGWDMMGEVTVEEI